MTNGTKPEPFVFEIDFTEIELTRQAEVRKALGDDYDYIGAMREEELAYRMLFANLDAEQRAVYAELVRHGVLPPREGVVDAG
ncbi:MAG TPA: DUF6400 family protein [Pseudonocardiaceae bacterium]|nr:DUF6400 family protein [Pseudonocardiaceae bacterium]